MSVHTSLSNPDGGHSPLEQRAAQSRHIGHPDHLYISGHILHRTERGYIDLPEPEPPGLKHPPVGLRHRPYLPAQPDLRSEAHVRRYGEIEIRGQDSADNSQVAGRVGHPQPPGHIQEDILDPELETCPFLKHCKKHIEPADIKACS